MSELVYFKESEFYCKCGHCTPEDAMVATFLARLDELRARCGFPFRVNSAYRCPQHPKEAIKATPGTHSLGIATDIGVSNGIQRRRVVDEALEMGFTGIGVGNTFVHVDDRQTTPVLWTY